MEKLEKENIENAIENVMETWLKQQDYWILVDLHCTEK